MHAPAPTTDHAGVPDGFWVRDDHQAGPVPPLQHGIWIEPMTAGFRTAMRRWGLPVLGIEDVLVRGWVYGSFRPLHDGAEIAERIRTRLALPPGAELRAADRWLDELLPGWVARRQPLTQGLDDLGAADLEARVTGVAGGLAELVETRFGDIVIGALVGEWVLLAAELLGWDEHRALALVRGAPATTALARRIGDRGAGGVDDIELAGVLADFGDLLLGTDVLSPTVAERPDLVRLLASRSPAPPPPDGDDDPEHAWARAGVADPDAGERLRRALDAARRSQAWREATGDEVTCWLGALRRVALAAGARLAANGLVAEPGDALFLTTGELQDALGGRSARISELISARRAEHAAAVASPPPPVLGDPPAGPPGPPPGAGLPAPVARAMAAFGWIGSRIGAPPGPPVADATTISGVGAAPGRVTGVVRVVVDVAELGNLEPGDVVVCPTTSPAWDPILAVAGAVVCDGGGLFSHPAVMARELGIPAVVGTKVATGALRSGEHVTVDGDAGTVVRS